MASLAPSLRTTRHRVKKVQASFFPSFRLLLRAGSLSRERPSRKERPGAFVPSGERATRTEHSDRHRETEAPACLSPPRPRAPIPSPRARVRALPPSARRPRSCISVATRARCSAPRLFLRHGAHSLSLLRARTSLRPAFHLTAFILSAPSRGNCGSPTQHRQTHLSFGALRLKEPSSFSSSSTFLTLVLRLFDPFPSRNRPLGVPLRFSPPRDSSRDSPRFTTFCVYIVLSAVTLTCNDALLEFCTYIRTYASRPRSFSSSPNSFSAKLYSFRVRVRRIQRRHRSIRTRREINTYML